MQQSMSVKQVKDGLYDIYIRLDQTATGRIRRRVKCDSLLDALAIETQIRQELDRPARIQAHTVNAIARLYIPWMKNHQSEKTHLEKHRMLLSQILPFFGGFLPDRITSAAIDAYKEKRLAGRKIHRQVNLELLCLQSMIRWATEQRPALCNPLPFKPKALPYKRQIPHVATREEINAMLDHTSDLFHRSLFCAIYEAGLRSDEARRLRPIDINLGQRFIRVHGKGDKTRIVPISERLAGLLAERVKECGTEYLWDNIKSFKTAFNATKRRAPRRQWPYCVKFARTAFGAFCILVTWPRIDANVILGTSPSLSFFTLSLYSRTRFAISLCSFGSWSPNSHAR